MIEIAPGGAMDFSQPFVAHHFFPGPTGNTVDATTVHVRQILAGGMPPAVYQTVDLTQSSFKSLWSRIIHRGTIHFRGRPPHSHNRDILLLFDAPRATAPLSLTGRIDQTQADGFAVVVDPPPLSWRLVAVEMARNLPVDTDVIIDAQAESVGTDPAAIADRRLRLRPDIPCPSPTIAPDRSLQTVVDALRAGFWTIDQLSTTTDVSPARFAPFVAALKSVDIVVDAPKPLASWKNPFSFFGLHWSAYEKRIRRRYQRLCDDARRAPDIAGVSTQRIFERAYELLCETKTRRKLRRQLVAPSPLAGVTEYFRDRLHEATDRDDIASRIDLARRVIELEPTDRKTSHLLSELLRRENASSNDHR